MTDAMQLYTMAGRTMVFCVPRLSVAQSVVPRRLENPICLWGFQVFREPLPVQPPRVPAARRRLVRPAGSQRALARARHAQPGLRAVVLRKRWRRQCVEGNKCSAPSVRAVSRESDPGRAAPHLHLRARGLRKAHALCGSGLVICGMRNSLGG